MYKLTANRLDQARETLEKYRSQLLLQKDFDAQALERELMASWTVGNAVIKDVMIDIVRRHPRYMLVAVRFMEKRVADEQWEGYTRTLARAYGIRSYKTAGRAMAQKAFWEKAMRSSLQE